jgi:hypothetical protein
MTATREDRSMSPTACAPRAPFFAAALLALATALPAAAQDLGLRGWGLRFGVSSDPDQVLAGAHFDLGDIVPRLRLQPSVEIGVGDDAFTLQGLIPLHYRFATGGEWTPYAGGGVLLALIDYDDDHPRRRFGRDDDDFEIAPVAVGGLEWSRRGGRDVLLELQLGGGDAFDAKVVVGLGF